MQKWILGMGVAVAAAVANVVYFRSGVNEDNKLQSLSTRQSRAAPTVVEAEVSADPAMALRSLRSQIALLRAELSGTNARVSELEAAMTQRFSVNNAASTEDQATPSRADVQAASITSRKALMEEINADFEAEPRDAQWSSLAAATIQDVAKKDAPIAATLGSVECRSKTCRVELVDDTASSIGRALRSLAIACNSVLPNIVSEHVMTANGRNSYVLYMSRGDS